MFFFGGGPSLKNQTPSPPKKNFRGGLKIWKFDLTDEKIIFFPIPGI